MNWSPGQPVTNPWYITLHTEKSFTILIIFKQCTEMIRRYWMTQQEWAFVTFEWASSSPFFLSVLPCSGLSIPLVCCMTLIASSSPLLPFSSFIANPSLLPIPSTFQKHKRPEPALARTRWRLKPYAIYANLLPVSSQTEMEWAPPSPTLPPSNWQKDGQAHWWTNSLLSLTDKDEQDTVYNSSTTTLIWNMYTRHTHCRNSSTSRDPKWTQSRTHCKFRHWSLKHSFPFLKLTDCTRHTHAARKPVYALIHAHL